MTLLDHRPGFAIAMMGLAAFLLAAPASASTDHRDRRSHAEEGRRDDGVRKEDRHAHRGDPRQYGKHDPAPVARDFPHLQQDRRRHQRRFVHYHRRAPFFCRPCLDRFTSRDHFHRHLSRHHRIPKRRLSRLIQHHGWGWVFLGGRR